MPRSKASDEGAGVPAVKQSATAISLPSANIEHARVFENEMHNRLHGFESGIAALQGELEGQRQAFEAETAELAKKHEAAKGDLLRRIADLETGKRMATAALDVIADMKG